MISAECEKKYFIYLQISLTEHRKQVVKLWDEQVSHSNEMNTDHGYLPSNLWNTLNVQ